MGVGVGSQGMGVGSKCVSVNASPGSPFSSRSLTPSPQQRVVTPQPHQLTQVVGTPGQVLQIFHHQQATRNTSKELIHTLFYNLTNCELQN